MKKILLATILSLVMVGTGICQFDSGYPILSRGNDGLEVRIEATMDASTYDSLTTGWIDISDFDATTEFIQLYYIMTSNAVEEDTTWLLVDVYGNESASFTGAVNLTQLVDTTNSETATYVASVLSNKRPRFFNFICRWDAERHIVP